jgi:hypothetical protein
MSVTRTITDEYYFWNWLKNSGSYKNNFSLEGSKAVFNYFDNLSEELGETIEFDPIAWCCEFSEYQTLNEAWEQYEAGDATTIPDAEKLEYFQDRTTVLEAENGHIVVGEF